MTTRLECKDPSHPVHMIPDGAFMSGDGTAALPSSRICYALGSNTLIDAMDDDEVPYGAKLQNLSLRTIRKFNPGETVTGEMLGLKQIVSITVLT